MPLTAESIFALLSTAHFGAYVVSPDQTILFWNRYAERVSGYSSESVLGRRCYDVIAGITTSGPASDCRQGCPSALTVRSGQFPTTMQTRILCASGERKMVSITPMVIGGTTDRDTLIVHLFTDQLDGTMPPAGSERRTGDPALGQTEPGTPANPQAPPGGQRLTGRELEVLRLVALGWDTPSIARELAISPHTVLNHIRHFRRKLNATTKLDAVVTAIRQGLLKFD